MAENTQQIKLIQELTYPDVMAEFNAVPSKILSWRTTAPLRFTPKFEVKIIEKDGGAPLAGNRVAFNTKAPIKTRKTLGKVDVELGKVSMGLEKDEKEIQTLDEIRAGVSGDATKQYIFDEVYNDIDICKMGAEASIEEQVGHLHSTGKSLANTTTNANGDVVGDEIEFFENKTEHFGGIKDVKQKLNAYTTADTLGFISTTAKDKTSPAKKARYVTITSTAFDHIASQAATKKKLLSVAALQAGMGEVYQPTVEAINLYMRTIKAPQLIVVDSEIEIEKKGGETETINPYKDHILLFHELPNFAQTWFKPKKMSQAKNGVMQMQNEFSTITITEELNPDKVTTYVEAYLIVAPVKRKSMYFVNAMNVAWNNGEV